MDPKIYSNGSIEIYAQDKYSADKRWESFKLYLNKSYRSKISENFRCNFKIFYLKILIYYMKILKRHQLFEKININNIGYNKELKCRQLQNKDAQQSFQLMRL